MLAERCPNCGAYPTADEQAVAARATITFSDPGVDKLPAALAALRVEKDQLVLSPPPYE